jgi:predicted MFS family arabinose efflux permease
MWAWVGLFAAFSYSATMPAGTAGQFAKLTAFLAIAAGGIASIVAGLVADRIGKAEIAIIAMAASGTAALATAASFGGPAWLTFVLIVIWGTAIVPDSAQFSALVADAAPPEQAGSLLSLQTALGFTLTAFTVQLTPVLAERFGWPLLMAGLAIGPAYGIVAMVRLRRLGRPGR